MLAASASATSSLLMPVHEDDFVSDAIALVDLPGLGRTLVATRTIPKGTLLLHEKPLLQSVRELPRDLMIATLDAGDDAPEPDTLRRAHAFALASPEVQDRFLTECCGEEGFDDDDNEDILDARKCAQWCVQHDAACASVPPERLARALCIFTQNSFASDHGVGSAVHLHGSKWSHRCLSPNCDVEGNNRSGSRLIARAMRRIDKGESLHISYLTTFRHLSTRSRRAMLLELRGFWCRCADCQQDALRLMPCPACQPRDSHGMLIDVGRAGVLERIAPSPDAPPNESDDSDDSDDDTQGGGGKPGDGKAVDERHGSGTPPPSSVAAPTAAAWRCIKCGLTCSDASLATPCKIPMPTTAWAGSAGRDWPLPLAAGTVLTWERAVEDATKRMVDDHWEKQIEQRQIERTKPKGAALQLVEPEDAVGELVAITTLLDAVRAFLGEQHCVRFAMAEMRVEQLLTLSKQLQTADEQGTYPMDVALAERLLVTALGMGGHVAHGDAQQAEDGGPINAADLSAVDCFVTIWADLDALWQHHGGTREVRWWTRKLTALVGQLRAWGCARAFLSRVGVETVDARMRAVRDRAHIEDPKSKATKAFEDEVAGLQRSLDLAAPVSALMRTAGDEEGMVRMAVMMVLGWMMRTLQSVTGLLTDESRADDHGKATEEEEGEEEAV